MCAWPALPCAWHQPRQVRALRCRHELHAIRRLVEQDENELLRCLNPNSRQNWPRAEMKMCALASAASTYEFHANGRLVPANQLPRYLNPNSRQS